MKGDAEAHGVAPVLLGIVPRVLHECGVSEGMAAVWTDAAALAWAGTAAAAGLTEAGGMVRAGRITPLGSAVGSPSPS